VDHSLENQPRFAHRPDRAIDPQRLGLAGSRVGSFLVELAYRNYTTQDVGLAAEAKAFQAWFVKKSPVTMRFARY